MQTRHVHPRHFFASKIKDPVQAAFFCGKVARLLGVFSFLAVGISGASAQPASFAGTAQHTAQYSPPAQHLSQIRWSTSINLNNSGGGAHYGAPLVTSANTVLVPVRTSSGFQVSAFEGSTGRLKYTLTN